jgi:hypothetical protein
MATEERARQALYDRLEEVIGDDHAATLMQYLPPHPSDLATKSDLRELRTDLGHRMDVIDQRVDGINHRVDGIDQRVDGIDQRVDGINHRVDGIDQRMERFDDRLHDLHGALREQTRVFIAASAGTMLTLSIVAFGATRLI